MKKFIKILSVMLLAFVCLSMSACSSITRVERALEKIGYTAIEFDKTAENMEKESEVPVTTCIYSNSENLSALEFAKLNIVIVFEFKTTDEMKDFYKDSSTLQGLVKDVKEDGTAQEFYDELVEKGFAKGNCLIISTNVLLADTVCEAIKNS